MVGIIMHAGLRPTVACRCDANSILGDTLPKSYSGNALRLFYKRHNDAGASRNGLAAGGPLAARRMHL